MSLKIILRKNYKIRLKKIVETRPVKNLKVNFNELSYDKFNLTNVDKYISVAPARNIREIKAYHKILTDEFVPKTKSQNILERFLNSVKRKSCYFMSKTSSGKTEVIKNAQNEIIGGLKYEKTNNNLHIYSLAVKESKRKGKSRENILVQIGLRLKKIAEEKKVETFSCDVLKFDKQLIKMYTNAGFFPVSQTMNEIHMKCPVKNFCNF